MNKVFVSIGPVNIYWYSLLILIAVLVGCDIAVKYSRKLNMPSDSIMDMIFGLVVSAIIGARVYYVIFNFGAYKSNFMDIFKIWEGGLAIYGSIIAGVLYILYYSVKKKLSFIRILDVCTLSLLLGQAIGRWGNFFNGEAYGRITTYEVLSNQHIPKFIIDGMYIDGAYRMPTFLYESIWCFVGVIILGMIRRKKSNIVGKQVSFYLIWYGLGRFFIEQMRSDSLYLGSFRVSQIVSVILVVIGVIGNVILYKRNHQRLKNVSIGGTDGRV